MMRLATVLMTLAFFFTGSAMADVYTCGVFEDVEDGANVDILPVDTSTSEPAIIPVTPESRTSKLAVCHGHTIHGERYLVCGFGKKRQEDVQTIADLNNSFELAVKEGEPLELRAPVDGQPYVLYCSLD